MDFRLEGGRPGDERGFVHRKIGKFLKGPLGDVALGLGGSLVSGLFGGKKPARTVIPREFVPRLPFSNAPAIDLKFRLPSGNGNGVSGGGRECPRGMRPDFLTGECEAAAGQEFGEAVMGRYGAGLIPGSMIVDRAVCPRGTQLGDDGVCYNKSQISNKQRMWPAGRRPLLTGGDMRAISIAARAGKRLEGATKRLQRMGMMKKPSSRRHPALRIPVHQRLTEAHVTK